MKPLIIHIKTLLCHRYLPLGLAGLAMLLSLPALWSGLLNDDYPQQIELSSPSQVHQSLEAVGLGVDKPGDLKTLLAKLFIAVGPNKNKQALLDYGALPWWTSKSYQVSLLRPIAVLTHWFDHRFLGGSVVLMHLHNLLWLGLLVGLVGRLYGRLLPVASVAGLAALFYALDDNHYFPAMWIANRNQLMALCLGIGALLAHDHWRRDHAMGAAVVSLILLGLSLLSAEAGIATFAYLFAYEVTLDRARWFKRGLALLPSVLLILLWRHVYNVLGYGARGGGFYFDPAGEPLAFARAALQRAPFLLTGQWLSLPPELFVFIHRSLLLPWVLGIGLVAVAVPLAMGPLLKRDPVARFWLIGMVCAIVPVCAAVPMGRNLLFAGIGGFALMAQFIYAVWTGQDKTWFAGRSGRGVVWALASLLLLIHLPLALVTQAAAPWMTGRMTQEMGATLDVGELPSGQDRELVVVNAPNPASFLYVPYVRAWQGQTLPRAIHQLVPGFNALEVERPRSDTLVVRSLGTDFLHSVETSRLGIVFFYGYLSDFFGPKTRFEAGQRFSQGALTLEILAADEAGMPLSLRVQAAQQVDLDSLQWVNWDWKKERFHNFSLPKVGQTRTISGPY